MEARSRALAALCATEIVSWGVLYYAFPVLVGTISADTGWSVGAATGAFSLGALISAGAGIVVGRLIDRRGPRLVMTAGSVIGVLATLAIATAPTLPLFYAAWAVAGLAQAATFYPPAFAAITGWYGEQRVRALTTLTLVAGFSSTVFAPLTAALVGPLGWRGTFVVLAGILAVVTVPLHALLLTPPWRPREHAGGEADGPQTDAEHARAVLRSPRFVGVTVVMTAGAFGLYATTINLVPLLEGRGLDLGLAALALGLTGAGQVLGRLGFVPLVRRTGPRARIAMVFTLGGVGVVALALVPGPAPLLIALAVRRRRRARAAHPAAGLDRRRPLGHPRLRADQRRLLGARHARGRARAGRRGRRRRPRRRLPRHVPGARSDHAPRRGRGSRGLRTRS